MEEAVAYIKNTFIGSDGIFFEVEESLEDTIASKIVDKGWKGTVVHEVENDVEYNKLATTNKSYAYLDGAGVFLVGVYANNKSLRMDQLLYASKYKFFDLVILNHPKNVSLLAQLDLAFLQPSIIMVSKKYVPDVKVIYNIVKKDDQYYVKEQTQNYLIIGRID